VQIVFERFPVISFKIHTTSISSRLFSFQSPEMRAAYLQAAAVVSTILPAIAVDKVALSPSFKPLLFMDLQDVAAVPAPWGVLTPRANSLVKLEGFSLPNVSQNQPSLDMKLPDLTFMSAHRHHAAAWLTVCC
jgi:hypothetical protein